MKFLNNKAMFLSFLCISFLAKASWGFPVYFKVDPEVMKQVDEIKEIVKKFPVTVIEALNKPELDDVLKVFTGTKEEQAEAAKNLVTQGGGGLKALKQAAEDQGIPSLLAPNQWYLARYGFIFGAAVFAGFNGLYYIQQAVKDYLAIRKPKYISPLSRIGGFDQYKELAKSWIYGFKKHENDEEAQHIVDQLQTVLPIKSNGNKQYNHLFIQDNVSRDDMRLFSIVAQKLDMDFIAVPSINLLQKNTLVELWNELVQLIHKNNRPVLLYIDQAELLSMDGTEYSEREDNINVLASCIKSAMAVFKSKCMIVGLSRNKEILQGPFTEIFNKNLVLN